MSSTNQPLSLLLSSVDTPAGRERLAAYLETMPFPRFESGPDGLMVKIDQDETRTVGRFVNRRFQPR